MHIFKLIPKGDIHLFVGFLSGVVAVTTYFVVCEIMTIGVSDITNAIIATGTITAVYLQKRSMENQEKVRVWEASKEELLSLASLLRQVIEVSKYEMEVSYLIRAYPHEDHSSDINKPDIESDIYQKLYRKFSFLANEYSVLLPGEIIDQVGNCLSVNERLNHESDWRDQDDLIEEILPEYTKLYELVQKRIINLSSIIF
jgi:hypothetical protein